MARQLGFESFESVTSATTHEEVRASSPRLLQRTTVDCRCRIMQYVDAVRTVSSIRIKVARAIAICADLVQIGLPMVFGEGFLSPFQDAVDVVVCITLSLLVGWHFAFLPSFVVKLVPLVDLAPTWTIAIFVATRKSRITTLEPTMKKAMVTEDKKVA